MAHMIPTKPKDFDEKSEEGIVFKALEKLPDDYYVFHSVKVENVQRNKLFEREMDFVVVHQKYGVLCIEAKNSKFVKYYDRDWHYSSGKIMDHGGPYNQAASFKRVLRNKMKYHKNPTIRDISYNCKMFHAVWFFTMDRRSFEEYNSQGLPEDADMSLTLFSDDILNPTPAIEKIFKIDIPLEGDRSIETKIGDDEFQSLLNSFFCPEFNLITTPAAKNMLIEDNMNQLLYEQYRLLEFLEDQDNAVINGVAGTGKTMLAVEKARRNSLEGESVLFLCYNSLLCDELNSRYKKNSSKSYREQFKNVDFMTISKLAKEKTGNYTDIDGLINWLIDCVERRESFDYKHVIIDEGQDFGLVDEMAGVTLKNAEDYCSVLEWLQDIVKGLNGTFYLFYDKYQTIQGGEKIKYKLPSCISDADCRLTLHRNCRNTKEIAQTSVTPLKDSKARPIRTNAACTWFEPVKPVMHLIGTNRKAISTINSVLDKYREAAVENVVILTQGTLDYCCLEELEKGNFENKGYAVYKYNGIEYKVTTCIKFKGLEADAIVLIDLDKSSFTDHRGLEFYVGTSRAKQYLDYVVKMTPEEYPGVISELQPNAHLRNDPERLRKVLSGIFSSEIVVH